MQSDAVNVQTGKTDRKKFKDSSDNSKKLNIRFGGEAIKMRERDTRCACENRSWTRKV